MNADRKSAIITGVLFIIGFAGVLTVALTKPILDDPDYLVKVSANANRIILGAFFQIIMAAACAGIGISLYPVLRKYNEGLALGAVGFRIIEAVFQIVGAVILLLLLTLSQEFVKAGALDSSHFQTEGALLLAGSDWVNHVAVLLVWSMGALMYYSIFYRTKLIPRWLSGWGLVGITLTIVASILFMFRLIGPMSTIQVALNIPIAVQEMVLAIWLIVKGFNPSAIELSLSTTPSTSGGRTG
jgi:Domain of unknown function (DUF4386)